MRVKPLTIAGGGIAGLTLGIALRQHHVPVTLWEAGKFPRHRVCGEFISGKGQNTLAELGLLDQALARGARIAHTAAFFANGLSQKISLPEPGLGCSRFALDHLLACEFRELGGDLREQQRWHGAHSSEGVILATGRRIHSLDHGWRWLGLKAHARDVITNADVEIHLSPRGYIGLCQLDGGITNICGLFRSRQPWSHLAERWPEQLRGDADSELHQRTEHALFDHDSFCSITALGFRPDWRSSQTSCRLGDAFSVIAPISGNGMSIALESADLARDPLVRYSRGHATWTEAIHHIGHRLRRAFTSRLWLAWSVQSVLFQPILRRCAIRLLWRHPSAVQFLVERTRD